MIIMIMAELTERHKQSPSALGGEGQSLGTKDVISVGPVDTHWSHVYKNEVKLIQMQYMCLQYTKYISKSIYGDLVLYGLVLMQFSIFI